MKTSISNNWTRRSEARRVHPPAGGVSRVINLIFYFFRYSQSVKYANLLLGNLIISKQYQYFLYSAHWNSILISQTNLPNSCHMLVSRALSDKTRLGSRAGKSKWWWWDWWRRSLCWHYPYLVIIRTDPDCKYCHLDLTLHLPLSVSSHKTSQHSHPGHSPYVTSLPHLGLCCPKDKSFITR